MYLLAVGRLVRRRWLAGVFGLLGAVLLCCVAADRAHVQYSASSQMMLILPPQATGADTPTNPYLNLPDGLVTTAGLISGNLSTLDAQRALAQKGDSASYTIEVIQGAGPLIRITATDASPSVALATRDALMTEVDARLGDIQGQAAAPADQVMRATRSSVSEEAVPSRTPVVKAIVAAAVLGLLYVVAVCFVVDQVVSRRRRRRTPASTQDPPHEPSTSPDAMAHDATADDAGAEETEARRPVAPAVESVLEQAVRKVAAALAEPSVTASAKAESGPASLGRSETGTPRPARSRRPRPPVVARQRGPAAPHDQSDQHDRSLAG